MSFRFYVNQNLCAKETISLESDEFYHLSKVLRKKKNEKIEIANGNGQVAIAVIIEIAKNQAIALIESVIQMSHTRKSLILVQGSARGANLDLIVEKTTELGVDEIWIFMGDLSEKTKVKENRLRQIIVSAIKQSKNPFLPKLKIFPSLYDIPKIEGDLFWGDFECDRIISPSHTGKDHTYIVIGPEKGLSAKEKQFLQKQKALNIKLNPNILRCETASIASVAILKSYLF